MKQNFPDHNRHIHSLGDHGEKAQLPQGTDFSLTLHCHCCLLKLLELDFDICEDNLWERKVIMSLQLELACKNGVNKCLFCNIALHKGLHLVTSFAFCNVIWNTIRKVRKSQI